MHLCVCLCVSYLKHYHNQLYSIKVKHILASQNTLPNCIDCSAIDNDGLSSLELAITPAMGHDGWANVVTLSKKVWKQNTNAF